MIKKMRVLVSLFLMLILTGCSTKENDVTPTTAASPTEVINEEPVTEKVTDEETPSSTSAPVAEQSELNEEQPSPASLQERAIAREIVEIKSGDSFDFNGDGNIEQIKCERANNDEDCVDYVLSIGNATYSFYLDNPTDKLYVSHMTEYDGEDLQVLIDEYGPSDDCKTNIFYYEEGEINYLGSVGGLVLDIKSLGDGLYETTERAQTLQTWYHPRKFYITDNGYLFDNDTDKKLEKLLVRMPNEMYRVGTRVILKCDITLLQSQQSKSEEIQLQKDQFATIVASDDEEWLYLESDEGQAGWLRIKDVGDFFEGLWYYD